MKTQLKEIVRAAASAHHANLPLLLAALALTALPLQAVDSSGSGAQAAKTNAPPSAMVLTALNSTQTAHSSGLFAKPTWLIELSLGIRESYDNNVFLSSVDREHAPAITVPPGGVETLKNRGSWITTISPKVAFDFAPLLGDKTVLQALTLAYAPDFVTYHDASSESYDIHRLITGMKIAKDDVSFVLDDSFVYIDGDDYGPSFPGGYNAYTTGVLRERRTQIQNKTCVTLQYDQDVWFARVIGSWLDYDLLTKQFSSSTCSGYQNYIDRYDLNGGVDVGYKVIHDFAFTVGYRYGHQYQEHLGLDIDPYWLSASSDYQRFLLGCEGTLLSWLKVKYQGGPDVRNYVDTAPVLHRSVVDYYGEGSLEATLSPKDVLTLKYKQWEWVSSTAKIPFFESIYALNYARKLTDPLTLNLGAQAVEADYHNGLNRLVSQSGTTNVRDDWMFTGTVSLRYVFNSHMSADLTYAGNFARNGEGDIVGSQNRDFTDNIISMGTQLKF